MRYLLAVYLCWVCRAASRKKLFLESSGQQRSQQSRRGSGAGDARQGANGFDSRSPRHASAGSLFEDRFSLTERAKKIQVCDCEAEIVLSAAGSLLF